MVKSPLTATISPSGSSITSNNNASLSTPTKQQASSTASSTIANNLSTQFNELSINESNNSVNNNNNKQISPSSIASSSSSSTSSSSFCSNIPNTAKCICSYTAITEDEICLQKGDLVQIITANLHNRFLVHREATNLTPAAEGLFLQHLFLFFKDKYRLLSFLFKYYYS